MKNKLIPFLTSATLLCTTHILAADNDKVEISFKVGDSILTVNGAPLEVTAPYVVGEGTTLVPIRVITEAFGAKVDWVSDTQTVNLSYPDVEISIKINSKSANINTHTEELSEAPRLYNGTTMVPLRFISETFGAKVDYDNDTQLITVIKENTETGKTVEGMTDKEYIGDSYYGWSIKNPKMLDMDYRSFNGDTTSFSNEQNEISIYIDEQEENYDIETEFNDFKSFLADRTISIADKQNLSDGSVKIHFRARNKFNNADILVFIKGNKEYSVYTYSDIDSDIKEELYAISESFSLTEKRDIYDLSNTDGNYREFKDKNYNITLNLPASWIQEDTIKENQFAFKDTKNPKSSASIEIYSSNDDVNAKTTAELDRQRKLDILNPNLTHISEIEQKDFKGYTAYSYSINYTGSANNTYILVDTFIEVGDYVYNIAVNEKNLDEIEKIASTLEVEAPNFDEIGIILRDADLGGSNVRNIGDCKMTMSNMWKIYQTGSAYNLVDLRSASLMTINIISGNARENLNQFVSSLHSDTNTKVIENIQSKNLGGRTYYKCTLQGIDNDKNIIYITAYTTEINNQTYCFIYLREDIYYGGSIDKEAEQMIAGISTK